MNNTTSMVGYTLTLDKKCFYPSFSTTLKEVMYRIKQIQESVPTLPKAIIDDTCEHVWINSGNDVYKEYDLTSTQDEHIDFASNEHNYLENDIKTLKKRIKYAKTPMEKKQLSQQLNLAYKKRKDN